MTQATTSPFTRPGNLAGVDCVINGRAFTRLGHRNQGRLYVALLRLRSRLNPFEPDDSELIDTLNVEIDRLGHLMRVSS